MAYIESMHRHIYLQSQLLSQHAIWKRNLFRAEKTRSLLLTDTRRELEGTAATANVAFCNICLFHQSISHTLYVTLYDPPSPPLSSPLTLVSVSATALAFESSNEASHSMTPHHPHRHPSNLVSVSVSATALALESSNKASHSMTPNHPPSSPLTLFLCLCLCLH